MREILFRGKRIDNGEWVEGYLIIRVTGIPYIGWEAFSDKGLQVDPDTVGQYTGVTDKNGKRIFEGDIIQNLDGISVVVFDEKTKGFCMSFIEYPYETLDMGEMWDDTEIIGNANDNPELMGGGK